MSWAVKDGSHHPLEKGDRVKAREGKDTSEANWITQYGTITWDGIPLTPCLNDITPCKMTSFLGSPRELPPARPAKSYCFLPAFKAKGLSLRPWVPSTFYMPIPKWQLWEEKSQLPGILKKNNNNLKVFNLLTMYWQTLPFVVIGRNDAGTRTETADWLIFLI